MTDCPSREQLSNFLAERTIDFDGLELRAHMQSCARCRQIFAALSDGGPLEAELERSLVDRSAANDSASFAALAATWADSAEPAEQRRSEPCHAETIDVASPPIRTKESRLPVSETVDIPSQALETVQATGNLTAGKVANAADDETAMSLSTAASLAGGLPPSPAFLGDSQAMTLEEAKHSDATTDYDRDGGSPKGRRVSPGTPVNRGRNGPRDYEILGELGRGGMGVVYKARHRRLNRLVALKMIRGAYADEIQITRFKIEAEAVATLRHPNILQIYDIGESDGSPYVALELLEGGSLSDRLRGTALPPKQAAELMVPLVSAMDAAHRAGIVHRDLKSANILFSSDGIPKITDFGLAKRLEMDEGQTHTGQIMGTPSYMAPEQARGDTKSAGPPADIYSLGAMLYEMLTGRPPFKGISAIETVKQVIEEEPVSPSRVQFRVPRDLETICMKCLQKEPRKRYATAKEMGDDLSRYLAGEPIKARRTPLVERAFKWVRRHPTAATLLAFGSIGAASLIGGGLWYWNNKRTIERSALQHLALVTEETGADLLRAQRLMSENDLNDAQRLLDRRKTILDRENNSQLASQQERTASLLADVEKALEAQRGRLAEEQARTEVLKRFHRFLDYLKGALYRDTQFTGVTLPANLELTRKAATAALEVFARRQSTDDWELGELPAELTKDEQSEVRNGCYELLLVMAEAVAAQAPAQVDHALSILESADRLRPEHSRAYFLTKAACLALRSDRDGEARQIAEAQKVNPKSAFDYFLTGQQEYKREQYADAIRDFEIALRYKPDHFWARCLQAICYLRTNRLEAAKASLNGCIDTDRDFAWLYLLRGYASGEIGNRYLAALKDSRNQDKGLKKSAEHEFSEAEADLAVAMDLLKNAPDVDLQFMFLMNRGLVRLERGCFDEAASDYRDAIRLQKDPALAHAGLAYVYQKQNKPAEAIDQFTQAIGVKPDWPPLYRGRAEVRLARTEATRADRDAALSDLAMAIKHEGPRKPERARDHALRAKLFFRDGRYQSAVEECELALRILPERVASASVQAEQVQADALEIQIRALLQLRRFDEAMRCCDQAIAKGKKTAVLYELRGLAQAGHDDYPGAIRDFGRALEIRPDDPHLLNDRGWAYLHFDSPKLALIDFEAAIKRDTADANAYAGRGTAHARLGDHRAAVADARQALQLAKMDPRLTYNAARIYALAAPFAATEIGADGRSARALAAAYRDTALQLIREAIQKEAPERRATFWREIIQPDPAFSAIRRRLNFEDLIATSRKPNA
jgi:serine/threonine protein kinase/tetratricopeptide (TPR) repeat protein